MTATTTQPIGELNPDFSSPGAVSCDWAVAREAVASGRGRPGREPHRCLGFRGPPGAIFAFGRGEGFSQTRWRFEA